MASSSVFRQCAWCGPVAALFWLAFPGAAQAPEPPVVHRQLAIDVDGRPTRMHRFRIRVPQIRPDVFDLGFELPVSGSLRDTAFVVNGGYWEYHLGKRRMIGWVVSGGKQLSPLRAKLDGGVLLIRDGRARIVKSSTLDPKPEGVELAVQCKPRLLENRNVIPKLNALAHSARTAVCTRDNGSTLDVYLSDPRDRGPTLAALGTWLAAEGCVDALNLDGGPSTAAAYRTSDGLLKIGAGTTLPYAIRFATR